MPDRRSEAGERNRSSKSSRRFAHKPYPPAGYTGVRLYAELAELIRSRQSVIVFTNVRSAAEQIGLRLKELLPELAGQIENPSRLA